MRHRKLILIIGSLLLVASLALVAFMAQTSAADLLTEALENLETIESGHAVITATVDMPDQSGSATVEVWAQHNAGANGEPAFRIELLDAQLPADMTGEHDPTGAIAVSDGSNFWLWEPASNTVYVGTAAELQAAMAEQMGDYDRMGEHEGERPEMPEFDPEAIPETAAEAVELLLEYFEADRVGSDDFAGARANQIRLIPIPEQMPDEVRAVGGLINVWLDADLRVPVGAEYTGGALGSARITASDVQINIDLDASLFTFEPPADATIVSIIDLIPEMDEMSAVAQADLRQPTVLPDGARLIETVEMGGVAVQQYSRPDGGAFTVAQGPANDRFAPDEADAVAVDVGGFDGTVFTDGEGARLLLTWREGETQFWIGGDLTADEALGIAESLK